MPAVRATRGSRSGPITTNATSAISASLASPSSSIKSSDCKLKHYWASRSEEHTSELQSPDPLVCRLLLEKKNKRNQPSLDRDPRNSVFGAGVLSDRHHDRRSFFFFNDTATTEIYTLSLHDALPI